MYLPLTNNPEENFNVSVFEIVYIFRQLWNGIGFWALDIKDVDGNILVYGVKLITKEYLLQQYPQIPFELKSENETDPGRLDLESFLLEVTDKNV